MALRGQVRLEEICVRILVTPESAVNRKASEIKAVKMINNDWLWLKFSEFVVEMRQGLL